MIGLLETEPFSPHTVDVPNIILPQPGLFALDKPGCLRACYCADRKSFDKIGMAKRRSIIRPSTSDEFDPPFAPLWWPPTLFVQVIRISGWHYRLPVWRGSQPYSSMPNNDEEVASLAADCIERGGYDRQRLEAWQFKWTEQRQRTL